MLTAALQLLLACYVSRAEVLKGWGNNEAQCYTTRPQNARVVARAGGAAGVLVLSAQFHEDGLACLNPGADNSTRYWSSARLISRNKAAFGYESTPMKFEARVKVPNELGAWPAFWLLPNTHREDCLACGDFGDGWCSSGEVDILEARNRDGLFRSTVHYGGLPDQSWLDCHQATADFNASAAVPYWNRVSAVMGNESIAFYVNDTLVHTVNQTQWYTGGANKTKDPAAPFNRPFYMLLNLAVGGNFPAAATGGNMITDTRRAPYRFMVDWVRVYSWRPTTAGGRRRRSRRFL
ncbi:hypothetical protein GPECTOR_1g572 [Gonium pectorale]|uniref:GH16 domain-containing protein n=1 Tax=Gonium pectorale TaxID=33097 RepID=A0A150H3N0_GONPE|nr:hypothetical protein GPECTOR_1g572 [Gonium pectorale]|eukprot:KXZ56635.1 hypothetical protein GPECTOR_1g572 [Gonium pectorale]